MVKTNSQTDLSKVSEQQKPGELQPGRAGVGRNTTEQVFTPGGHRL